MIALTLEKQRRDNERGAEIRAALVVFWFFGFFYTDQGTGYGAGVGPSMTNQRQRGFTKYLLLYKALLK
jgi:hypothetical protein